MTARHAVTVTQILNNNWWYMSCKGCKKKKSDPQPGGGYKCPKCQGTTTMPRYLLSFTANDDTAEASFYAYDDIARQMIQKESKATLNPLKMMASLPQQVNAIVSKKFVFSIGLTEDYTSKARRKCLINSGLDRRSSVLNISVPELRTPNTPAPLTDACTSGTLPHAAEDTQPYMCSLSLDRPQHRQLILMKHPLKISLVTT